jgi:hypothetical protein
MNASNENVEYFKAQLRSLADAAARHGEDVSGRIWQVMSRAAAVLSEDDYNEVGAWIAAEGKATITDMNHHLAFMERMNEGEPEPPEFGRRIFIALWDASVGMREVPPNGYGLLLECGHSLPPRPPHVTEIIKHIYCDQCRALRRYRLLDARTGYEHWSDEP